MVGIGCFQHGMVSTRSGFAAGKAMALAATAWSMMLPSSVVAQYGLLTAWGGEPATTGFRGGVGSGISAGFDHTLALRPDGTVTGWGFDVAGCTSPWPGTFTQVAAGFYHNVALWPDGTVVCWGLNEFGQCNAPAGVFTRVSAGYRSSAGVRADGSIVVWGLHDARPVPPGPFSDVWVGKEWFLARRVDGTLAAWGFDNAGGQQNVPPGRFLSASPGKACFGVGVREDGTLVHWGCAGGPPFNLAVVPPGQFVEVAAGSNFALARRADGTVVGWGLNDQGQLSIPAGRFGGVTAGYGFGVALTLCYANCDDSSIAPVLNVNDFICFVQRYAAGDTWANCDGSSIAPVLNVNDFVCYLMTYAGGCP